MQGANGRWLALAALAWLAGAALQLQQAELPPRWLAPALAAAAALALPAARSSRRRWLLLPAAAALAFALADARAGWRVAEMLDPALEGRDVVVTGVVAQMPRIGADGARFAFDVETADVRLPPRLSLGWTAGADGDALATGAGPDLRAGQRWRFTIRPTRSHGTLNPHGFDLELWLFEQGIGGGGTVRSRPGMAAVKLAETAGAPIERLRQDIRDAIVAHVPDASAAGVLAALAVGDQAAIGRDDWDLFRATGVAHLMSISGLHVTMFAWLAGVVAGALWRRSARLALWLPAPQAARVCGLAAAFGYALVAGFGVPAQRTVWMIATVVLLQGAGLRWPLFAVLAAAAVVVTAVDPWALLQPGFWLSFVAVALLAHSGPAAPAATPPATGWRRRAATTLRDGLRSQLVATVGLAPLSMAFFGQVSLVGFAANVVAIPLVTLVVTPLALLGIVVAPLWAAAAALVRGLATYLGWIGSDPVAVWNAGAAPAWAVVAGLVGALVAVLPLPWRLRALAVPLMLPLALPPHARPAAGRFEAVAADVGQGTAVIVRTRDHVLVYDTGPQYTADADAGQRVLLPLLRARGEHRVDLLVLSHRDADHTGGAASLLAGMPVAAMTSSLEPSHPLLARGRSPIRHTRCNAGQAWDWDGVRFELLHPFGDAIASATPNAQSCVLRVQGTSTSLLLTGDIEAAQEAALVATGAALRSDVLVVPHHGSRTSSTPAFIAAVAPRAAVVQAGYRSRYGHPAPDVVARYDAAGIDVVRSDRCGAWTLPSTPGMPAVCERSASRRYWHHRP